MKLPRKLDALTAMHAALPLSCWYLCNFRWLAVQARHAGDNERARVHAKAARLTEQIIFDAYDRRVSPGAHLRVVVDNSGDAA